MKFAAAISLFIEDGRARGLSPRTLSQYRASLGRFAEWAGCRGVDDVRDATLEHVLDFRRSLDARRATDGRQTSRCRCRLSDRQYQPG